MHDRRVESEHDRARARPRSDLPGEDRRALGVVAKPVASRIAGRPARDVAVVVRLEVGFQVTTSGRNDVGSLDRVWCDDVHESSADDLDRGLTAPPNEPGTSNGGGAG